MITLNYISGEQIYLLENHLSYVTRWLFLIKLTLSSFSDSQQRKVLSAPIVHRPSPLGWANPITLPLCPRRTFVCFPFYRFQIKTTPLPWVVTISLVLYRSRRAVTWLKASMVLSTVVVLAFQKTSLWSLLPPAATRIPTFHGHHCMAFTPPENSFRFWYVWLLRMSQMLIRPSLPLEATVWLWRANPHTSTLWARTTSTRGSLALISLWTIELSFEPVRNPQS